MKERKFYILAALIGAGFTSVISGNLAWAQQTVEDASILLAQASESENSGRAFCKDPELENALVNHFLKRFFNRIDATEVQKKEISALVQNKRTTNQAKRDALKTGLRAFLKASSTLDNSEASDAALREQAKQLRTMHEALMDDRLESFLKIRNMLDSKQKEKLSSIGEMFSRRFSGAQGATL